MKEHQHEKDGNWKNDKDLIEILTEQENKLKFAVWDHMEFLNKFAGIDVLDTLGIVDDIVTSACLGYDEDEENFEE